MGFQQIEWTGFSKFGDGCPRPNKKAAQRHEILNVTVLCDWVVAISSYHQVPAGNLSFRYVQVTNRDEALSVLYSFLYYCECTYQAWLDFVLLKILLHMEEVHTGLSLRANKAF